MDTEVIVVDTDPEHRAVVREIYEKYADKIIPFEWCDDFSAARNVSVDAAEGERYLYIDDDEWFMDAQPIIDFLLSSKAGEISYASHLRRDYYGHGEHEYRDTWVDRLFRLDGNVRFRSRIHEYPYPVEGSPCLIHALSGHTGYLYETEEEKLAHTRRNLALLQQMAQEEPAEVRWVFQLMLEHAALGDRQEELKLAHKGYEMMSGAKEYRYACIRGIFAADILRVDSLQQKWQECLKDYERMRRSKEPLGKVASSYMEYEAAIASYHMRDDKAARRHCLSFLEAKKNLGNEPAAFPEEYAYFLMDTFKEDHYAQVLAILVTADIRAGSWESLDAYFDDLERNMSCLPEQMAEEVIDAALGCEYDGRLEKMVSALWKSRKTRKAVQKELLNRLSES
ncbi:MAG: hypothetical protein IJ682_14290 [Lachnospiraceae bacterium]|nr:hypothetical protein [Lachnospiraceae bacterium]